VRVGFKVGDAIGVIGVVLVGVGVRVVIEEGELAQDVSSTKQNSIEVKMTLMRLINIEYPS